MSLWAFLAIVCDGGIVEIGVYDVRVIHFTFQVGDLTTDNIVQSTMCVITYCGIL